MSWLFLIILIAVGVGIIAYVVFVYAITKVPHVATPTQRFAKIFDHIHTHISNTANIRLLDFGSGFGRVLFEMEKRGIHQPLGYELSPIHAAIANFRARFHKSSAQTINANMLHADLSQFTVIYAFLNKNVMPALSRKLTADAVPGTLVLVLCDELVDRTPMHRIPLDTEGKITLNCYVI